MQQNVRTECPKCSRPLKNFNGKIGYCSQHQWVSPLGLGFDAEAAEQNRQDAAAEKERLMDEERREAQAVRARKHSALKKVAALIAALCLVVAAGIFFVVRPIVNYRGAADKFAAGDYEAALTGFEELGGYKDAQVRAQLCNAMLDMRQNRSEDAIKKLSQLIDYGNSDVAGQVADALLPMVKNWEENGLTPQILLFILSRADAIGIDGELDIATLQLEGHAELLDGTQLATYAEDVDEDGQVELIALNVDYSVAVYRMTADSNVKIAVDNRTASACSMAFGKMYSDVDVNIAIACFSEAHRLMPEYGTRMALADAYSMRSYSHENAGRIDAAIADAKSAMEVSGSKEDFNRFYNLNLEDCKTGNDSATAISLWYDFAANCALELTRYSATARWQRDAAQLHITYAVELATQGDTGCVAELRAAADMGADIMEAIGEVEAKLGYGLALAQLRLMEIEILGGNDDRVQQIRSEMESEVRAAISEWKDRGIAPSEVPSLIVLADQHSIDLSGIDSDNAYKEAAVAATGNVLQSCFVDWDEDGYSELLALNSDGRLVLYGVNDAWNAFSELDTGMASGSFAVADKSVPIIMVLSGAEDELMAVACTDSQLSVLFRESGISRYSADGQSITFSRRLEGSIERYSNFAYEALDVDSRPVCTGVDWQQSDYPQPASAVEAVERYFEARTYDIAGEVELLTEETANYELFDTAKLANLPVPDELGSIDAVAYHATDDMELFEVEYAVGTRTIRTWVSAEYLNGWKLTGAADTYGVGRDTSDVDYSIELISLNAQVGNTISQKGGRATYRVLVPTSGRLRLVWQSGTKAASRTSHAVTMYCGNLTGDTVFAYELQPSPNRQQSKDMLVAAGAYYVTVEARTSDAEEYKLTLSFDSAENVELEDNDTTDKATLLGRVSKCMTADNHARRIRIHPN